MPEAKNRILSDRGSDTPDNEKYGLQFNAEPCENTPDFGVTLRDDGCDFAVHVGPDVDFVDFCMSNPDEPSESIRWRLNVADGAFDDGATFAGFIPDLKPGDLYGIRVGKNKDPDSYDNLLLDPYAKAITRLGQPDHPDSQAYCVITDEKPRTIERPPIKPKDRVIYETHIKNATMLNPDIPEELRGTYLGFAHPANIARLKELGITTVEIMPIMQFFSEEHLAKRSEPPNTNHWGYNTVGFFAPHEGYASDKTPGTAIKEVKEMIDALHAAGIEVVLDVVYNHTADSGMDSKTYSLRGLDNQGYYHTCTDENGRQNYIDATGCGNNIDTSKPAATKLITDSLHYWHEVMGADGFRFDLASATGDTSFFKGIKKDRRLEGCLLIAEPWSFKGYPRGSYARIGMPEWDGEYRDFTRGFWGKGSKSLRGLKWYMSAAAMGEIGTVNFITAHDGFTVRDLTTYDNKHNKKNGEGNRDGTDDNRSHNHGHEGETDTEAIRKDRRRTARNFMATLAMSYGMPMIREGDEVLHTQHGNNNAYCQDNGISWIDWGDLAEERQDMLRFVKDLLAIRRQSPIGDSDPSSNAWFNVWGEKMDDGHRDWDGTPAVGMYVSGKKESSDFIFYVNASGDDVEISLPKDPTAESNYEVVADTYTGESSPEGGITVVAERLSLEAMSSVIVRKRPGAL